jgi:hypothetical protein
MQLYKPRPKDYTLQAQQFDGTLASAAAIAKIVNGNFPSKHGYKAIASADIQDLADLSKIGELPAALRLESGEVPKEVEKGEYVVITEYGFFSQDAFTFELDHIPA